MQQNRSERNQNQHSKEIENTVKNIKNIMSAIKSHNKNGNGGDFPLTNLKKGLEGQALKEKMKQKESSGYDWELY